MNKPNNGKKGRNYNFSSGGGIANAGGRIYAWSDAFASVFIGCILISIGIFLLQYKIKRTETGTATIIKNSVQTTTGSGKDRKTQYIAHYKYTPSVGSSSGTLFDNLTETIDTYYASGATATVYYNPNDPADCSLVAPLNPKLLGGGLIGLAICGMIISFIVLYVVRKNKTAAQIYGGGRLIGNVFGD